MRGEAGAPAARERRRQLRGVEVRGAAVQQLGHGQPGAEHQVSVLVPGPGAGGVAGEEHLASQARHHARHGAHAAAGEIFIASTLLSPLSWKPNNNNRIFNFMAPIHVANSE